MDPIENMEREKSNALNAEMITKHARFPTELIGIYNNNKKGFTIISSIVEYQGTFESATYHFTFFKWNRCPMSKEEKKNKSRMKRKTFEFENVFSFGHWKPLIWSLTRIFMCVLCKSTRRMKNVWEIDWLVIKNRDSFKIREHQTTR